MGEESPVGEDVGHCHPHIEMVRELAALHSALTSTVELVLGRSQRFIRQ
jgi:hypothetical protein